MKFDEFESATYTHIDWHENCTTPLTWSHDLDSPDPHLIIHSCCNQETQGPLDRFPSDDDLDDEEILYIIQADWYRQFKHNHRK